MFGKVRKHNNPEESVSQMTDVHSHILPGLDDGAGDWETSKKMLEIAYGQGIRTIIATPHFMPQGKQAAPRQIRETVSRLQKEADNLGMDMTIHAGNEIYFCREVPEMLEQGEILTLADSDYVLVEFAPLDDARYIRNSLAELQSAGFLPVLAHAERYENLCKKPFDRIAELRNMGILIQVNAASIEGKMGKLVQKQVAVLLKKQMVDLIGTDAHSAGSRAPYVDKAREILMKKHPRDYVNRLLYENAGKIINNE